MAEPLCFAGKVDISVGISVGAEVACIECTDARRRTMFEDATSPEFASMMAGTQALPWEQQEGHPLNRMDNAAARTFIMSLLKCECHSLPCERWHFSALWLDSVFAGCCWVQQQEGLSWPFRALRAQPCQRPASFGLCSFMKMSMHVEVHHIPL